MNKTELIAQIVAKLERELQALVEAAKAAHQAATHDESRAEDQYDTRGLEASYLAGAQAARVTELQTQIAFFRGLNARAFGASEPIAVGALIETESRGRRGRCLLTSAGGGQSITLADGSVLQVVSLSSPLGEALEGHRQGDRVEVESPDGSVREYRVLHVN